VGSRNPRESEAIVQMVKSRSGGQVEKGRSAKVPLVSIGLSGIVGGIRKRGR